MRPGRIGPTKGPGPVRSALTFGPQTGTRGTSAGDPALKPSLKVLSPKDKSSYTPGQDVVFRVAAKLPGGKAPDQGQLSWKLTSVTGEGQDQSFQGNDQRKKVPVGQYKFEVTMHGDQPPDKSPKQTGRTDVKESGEFFVAFVVKGKVKMGAGGVDGVNISVIDVDKGTLVSKASSTPKGDFQVHFPAHGSFRIEPQKEGFSFSPISRRVKFTGEALDLQFTAAKASIEDMRLAISKDDDTKPESVCPGDEVFLKLKVVSETRVTGIEAALVRSRDDQEEVVTIGEATLSTDSTNPAGPAKQESILVRIPSSWKQTRPRESCNLRATATDEAGNLFAAEATDPVVVDVGVCMAGKEARALQLQEKGDLEAAVRLYTEAIDLQRDILSGDETSLVASKCNFNGGLACLELALTAAPDDPNVAVYLGKALNHFTDVAKVVPKTRR